MITAVIRIQYECIILQVGFEEINHTCGEIVAGEVTLTLMPHIACQYYIYGGRCTRKALALAAHPTPCPSIMFSNMAFLLSSVKSAHLRESVFFAGTTWLHVLSFLNVPFTSMFADIGLTSLYPSTPLSYILLPALRHCMALCFFSWWSPVVRCRPVQKYSRPTDSFSTYTSDWSSCLQFIGVGRYLEVGGRNFGETCRRHVACRRHAMLGGSGGMLPRKILNFRCVFLQSGGI